MTSFVPVVALVPEAVAEQLDTMADDAWARILGDDSPVDIEQLEQVFAANGWSHAMYVAGLVLSVAFEKATGLDSTTGEPL